MTIAGNRSNPQEINSKIKVDRANDAKTVNVTRTARRKAGRRLVELIGSSVREIRLSIIGGVFPGSLQPHARSHSVAPFQVVMAVGRAGGRGRLIVSEPNTPPIFPIRFGRQENAMTG